MDLYKLIPNIETEISIPEDGIVSRTVYQDDHLKAVLFGFSPGQELSEHTAAVPAIVQVLTGKARIMLGDDTLSTTAGTWIHMSPKLPHSILAETPVTMLLLLLKSARNTPAEVIPPA